MPDVRDVPSAPAVDPPEAAPASLEEQSPAEIRSAVQIQIPYLPIPETRHHRWLTFEDETSIDRIAVMGGIGLLLVGGFWFAFTKMLGRTLRMASWTPPVSTPAASTADSARPPRVVALLRSRVTPRIAEPLYARGDDLHAAPVEAGVAPPAPGEATHLPAPQTFVVRFVAPRLLEAQWDTLGEGYSYRLYWAIAPGLYDPQPVLDHPIPVTYLVWTPDEGLSDFWLTVTGIDPQGSETPFSRPLHIQLPR